LIQGLVGTHAELSDLRIEWHADDTLTINGNDIQNWSQVDSSDLWVSLGNVTAANDAAWHSNKMSIV